MAKASGNQRPQPEVSDAGNDLINAANAQNVAGKEGANPGSNENQAPEPAPQPPDTIVHPPNPEPSPASQQQPQPNETQQTITGDGSGQQLPPYEPTQGEQQNEAAAATDKFMFNDINFNQDTNETKSEQFKTTVKGIPTEELQLAHSVISEELRSRGQTAATAPTLSSEEKNLQTHVERVNRYGENYVVAKHKERGETIFSRQTWNNLSGNRQGWEEVVEVPPEVKALFK